MDVVTSHVSNESNEGDGMTKLPKIVAIINIAAGALMVVLGVTTYFLVQRELADEKITVAEDADNFAGEPVEGPLTAYSQAMVIKEHALDIGGGKTYAELPQDDPTRDTVMTASFLRASLFTSVVAFGVAALVSGLGLLFLLLGLAMLGILKRLPAVPVAATGPPLVASAPPPEEELAPQGLA
jgi:hypothetical protein